MHEIDDNGTLEQRTSEGVCRGGILSNCLDTMALAPLNAVGEGAGRTTGILSARFIHPPTVVPAMVGCSNCRAMPFPFVSIACTCIAEEGLGIYSNAGGAEV